MCCRSMDKIMTRKCVSLIKSLPKTKFIIHCNIIRSNVATHVIPESISLYQDCLMFVDDSWYNDIIYTTLGPNIRTKKDLDRFMPNATISCGRCSEVWYEKMAFNMWEITVNAALAPIDDFKLTLGLPDQVVRDHGAGVHVENGLARVSAKKDVKCTMYIQERLKSPNWTF